MPSMRRLLTVRCERCHRPAPSEQPIHGSGAGAGAGAGAAPVKGASLYSEWNRVGGGRLLFCLQWDLRPVRSECHTVHRRWVFAV